MKTKKVLAQTFGGFESFFGGYGKQDFQKLPQPYSRGNGFILVSFRAFPEFLSVF